jgi:hypothetical protein
MMNSSRTSDVSAMFAIGGRPAHPVEDVVDDAETSTVEVDAVVLGPDGARLARRLGIGRAERLVDQQREPVPAVQGHRDHVAVVDRIVEESVEGLDLVRRVSVPLERLDPRVRRKGVRRSPPEVQRLVRERSDHLVGLVAEALVDDQRLRRVAHPADLEPARIAR